MTHRQRVLYIHSYQDENTEALSLVFASGAWFSARLNFLGSVFITAVSVAALLTSQNLGNLLRIFLKM